MGTPTAEPPRPRAEPGRYFYRARETLPRVDLACDHSRSEFELPPGLNEGHRAQRGVHRSPRSVRAPAVSQAGWGRNIAQPLASQKSGILPVCRVSCRGAGWPSPAMVNRRWFASRQRLALGRHSSSRSPRESKVIAVDYPTPPGGGRLYYEVVTYMGYRDCFCPNLWHVTNHTSSPRNATNARKTRNECACR